MGSGHEGWYEELQSAYLYDVLARVERDERRGELFSKLAGAAREQARLWEDKRRKAGRPVPSGYRPSPRVRLVAWLLERLGPRGIRPVLAALKVRGLSVYNSELLDEDHATPKHVDEVGGRHGRASDGGNLRAAVFGVNDGLVSNASLIMGMAGATSDPQVVLVSGLAGLLAGAASMAAGEWVSVRSQREFYEHQIGLERAELELYPEEEAEELALVYNARGLPMDKARELSQRLFRDPKVALDTLSREELGLDPDDLGSPWGAAISSFLSFAVGAFIPVLPFVVGAGGRGVAWAVGLTAAALFGVGAATSLFTGRSALFGALRMLLIGAAAGGVTWLLGSALGTTLG